MRTIFVGDVHGCADELNQLLKKMAYTSGNDRLLLTGDAFSRGPDPLGVWHLIRECDIEMVMGNHDARLLQQLNDLQKTGDPGKTKADQRYTLRQLEPVHSQLLAWLRDIPLFIQNDHFLLVHAGINPERGLAHTSFQEFITIRTWPPIKGIEGPRWHDRYDGAHPLLVFGHDAPGGLVIKKRAGQPYLVGLDTGCVYGNQLSAYILEDRRLVQLNSQQKKGAWEKRK